MREGYECVREGSREVCRAELTRVAVVEPRALDGVSERVARLEGLAAEADEPRAGRRLRVSKREGRWWRQIMRANDDDDERRQDKSFPDDVTLSEPLDDAPSQWRPWR